MPKMRIRLPEAVRELDLETKTRIAEQFAKALGVGATEEWEPSTDPQMADLEALCYQELAAGHWRAMLEVFDLLGLELPLMAEKSLLRDAEGRFRPQPERFAYYTKEENPIYLPTNRIETPYQAEKGIDEAKVEELVAAMQAGKKLPPLVIGYNYDLHDGHHRLEASRRLGTTHVPCVVGGMDEHKVQQVEAYYRSLFKSVLPDGAFPLEGSGQLMWRGIGDGEMEFILEHGYIQSKGDGNAEDEERRTYFSPLYRQAENYARMNYGLYDAGQAYVLICRRPDNVVEDDNGEFYIKGRLPESYIVGYTPVDARTDSLQKAFRSWNEAKHPRDDRGRFATKWGRAIHIGQNLTNIRRKYRRDLKLPGMPRDKVTALMVGLIDKGCFRMGNDESAEERGVFGLTTLERQHVRVEGDTIHFDFIGKKGVHQKRSVTDKELARVMGEVLAVEGGMKSGGKEEAGSAIFKYYNTKNEVRTPSQYVVNSYLEPWGISAKDFRTFHASRLVFELLSAKIGKRKTQAARKKDIDEAVAEAARQLGHQPDTCRRYYVDPHILEIYMRTGGLSKSITEWPEDLEWKDYALSFLNYHEEGLGEAYRKLATMPEGMTQADYAAIGNAVREHEASLKKGIDDDLRSGVRKRFAARLRYHPDGQPWTPQQMAALEGALRKYNVSPDEWAENLGVRATVLGKVLSELERENMRLKMAVIETLPKTVEAVRLPWKLRFQDGSTLQALPLQDQELNAIEWAKLYAGEQIRSKQQDLVSGVKRLVAQARQERWEISRLQQALFDEFGHYNHDWRRIALTEMAYAVNNGYLMTLQDGDQVMIQEAADCCPQCKRVNVGKMLTYRKQPGNPETELWVGKSNYGNKARNYVPCAPLHPHCRGRYVRVNTTFFRMDDSGKMVQKTAAEILAERGVTVAEAPDDVHGEQ